MHPCSRTSRNTQKHGVTLEEFRLRPRVHQRLALTRALEHSATYPRYETSAEELTLVNEASYQVVSVSKRCLWEEELTMLTRLTSANTDITLRALA